MADRKDMDGRKLPENVIQRKDGTYMWKKSIDGRQYCLYAKTLGEIKRKRNTALGEIEAGTYKGKRGKTEEEREKAGKDITLNEWFLQWEKIYRIGKVRTSTLNLNRGHYDLYFSKNIGKMKVKDIKHADIVSVYNSLQEAGHKNSSMERYHTTLSLLFSAAIQNGIIDVNPAKDALHKRKESKIEKRVLTEEEEARFFNFLRESKYGYHKRYTPLFTVGFGTGMRIGEILALTWDDIDFEKNIIHVTKTINYIRDMTKEEKMHFVINPPKTESSIRDVPMVPKVKDALLMQRETGPKSIVTIDGYSNFVFSTKTGNAIIPRNIWNSIGGIVDRMNKLENEKAQIEGRTAMYFERFPTHSMRHTFATRCYEKGVREKVIQKILGHSSLDITLNVYTHSTDKMIEEDIKKLQ